MSLLILVGLGFVLLALPLQGLVRWIPRGAVSGTGVALSLLALLGGSRTAALPLPFGSAGAGGGLQLDALSCPFLLLSLVCGCFAEFSGAEPRRLLPCLAPIVLTMLAGDVFLLALGGVLALLAIGRTMPPASWRPALLAGCGLVGACTLLAGLARSAGALLPDGGFALVRGSLAVAGGGRGAGWLPALALVAAIPLLGLFPCGRWHRQLCDSQPGWMPGLAALLGQFLLLRLLLDLAVQPPAAWWGAGIVTLGLGSSLLAGICALRASRLPASIGSLLALQNGLVVAAAGICLSARAADLPVLAARALEAAMLLLPVQLLAGSVAMALAAAVELEAGAVRLSRLGGLAQSMPDAARLAAAAAAMLGFLPPLAGFAGLWLLLQVALPLARLGGVPSSSLAVTAIVAVAGFSVLGWLRLCAVVFLGRPRTPRGAAAQDVAAGLRRGCGILLGMTLLIGLVPGAWLRLVSPLRRLLSAGADVDPPPLLRLVAPGGVAGLSPLPLLLLLGLALGGLVWVLRRLRVRPLLQEAAWEGGMGPPPPWLPFGDPLAQIGPATLPRALQMALGLPDRVGRLTAGLDRRKGLRRGMRGAGAGLAGLLRRQGGLLALLLLVAVLAIGAWGWPA